jgi:hypothetical protein
MPVHHPHRVVSYRMGVEDIKLAIRSLDDDEIGPLSEWLEDYVNHEVWPRQMVADIERLGVDRWEAALQAGMAEASEKRQAALRLLNNMRFTSSADRDQRLQDFQTLLGETLD